MEVVVILHSGAIAFLTIAVARLYDLRRVGERNMTPGPEVVWAVAFIVAAVVLVIGGLLEWWRLR